MLLYSKKLQKTAEYRLTIGQFPDCSCEDFKDMNVRSKKRGAWAYCKHLYYIFRDICKLDVEDDHFVHAPTFNYNEVKKVMDAGVSSYIF